MDKTLWFWPRKRRQAAEALRRAEEHQARRARVEENRARRERQRLEENRARLEELEATVTELLRRVKRLQWEKVGQQELDWRLGAYAGTEAGSSYATNTLAWPGPYHRARSSEGEPGWRLEYAWEPTPADSPGQP